MALALPQTKQVVPSCFTCFDLQAWPEDRPGDYLWTTYHGYSEDGRFRVAALVDSVWKSAPTCEKCALVIEAIRSAERGSQPDADEIIVIEGWSGAPMMLEYVMGGEEKFVELFAVTNCDNTARMTPSSMEFTRPNCMHVTNIQIPSRTWE
jgi:hypothetical protein